MGTLWQDIRYALRMLARSPGFTAIVLLIVGVGIGANASLFNALDQVHMRRLPVRRPQELVSVQFRYWHGSWEDILGGYDYTRYAAYRDRAEVFAVLAAFKQGTWTLHSNDAAERIEGAAVSTDYFSTLGLQPACGHLLAPAPGQSPTAYQPVAVISHRLWHRYFEGRRDVIGKQLLLDDQALTVIGVTPAEFTGTVVGCPAEVFIPLGTVAHMEGKEVRDLHGVCVLGRLKPGVGREQAQAVLQVLDAQMESPQPDEPVIRALVFDGSQGYVPRDARVASYPLALFLGVAALVFVIACANIANLHMARAITRHKEIAVRQALGAGRWRVLRQLLVESVILALMGGACGIFLAVCLDRILCAVFLSIAPIRITPGLHPRTLLLALGISLAAGVAFGLAPALALIRRDVIPVLKGSVGCAESPARRWNPHNVLVVVQIAVALVVMVFSGLCLRSVLGLQHTDTGYDTRQILVVRFDLEGWQVDRPDLYRFLEDIQERVSHLPQVASTGLAVCAPVGETSGGRSIVAIEGAVTPVTGEIQCRMNVVGPGYFQTLGQALLAGRDFTRRDGPEAPKVIVINEVMAEQHWPKQNPIGRHISFRVGPGEEPDIREIVGIVKCVKLRSILEEPMPIAYLALDQPRKGKPKVTPVLLVRPGGNPHALIPMIRKEAATLGTPAALDIRTVAQRIWGLLITQRILTWILNAFGAVGLLLSATGIYAVMAYAVHRRTHEIGIRIALGARGRDVLARELFRRASLLGLGLTLGLGVSLAGGRVLTAFLPRVREWDGFFLQGISIWDPLTYVTAAFVIAVVVLVACYVPARRAAKVDPMAALRCE